MRGESARHWRFAPTVNRVEDSKHFVAARQRAWRRRIMGVRSRLRGELPKFSFDRQLETNLEIRVWLARDLLRCTSRASARLRRRAWFFKQRGRT